MVTVSEIVKETGLSQPYINTFFTELIEEGNIIKAGKSRNTHYVLPGKKSYRDVLKFSSRLKNRNLSESDVFDRIKHETGIFYNIPSRVDSLLNYAFTEILNNAIEHSQSETIKTVMERTRGIIKFEITDYGIGIFNNIKKKFRLHDIYEAINEVLKGKKTTMPERHSGEGIFFTSKAADVFTIQSSNKKILFNNHIEDIFLSKTSFAKGTRVTFSVSEKSAKSLKKIFDEYTDDEFRFSKTKVFVKLYSIGDEFISRSQARRILSGIDSFSTVILDFKNVKSAGQGFTDEVFRVFKNHNPGIRIEYKNANSDIEFMIKRTLSSGSK